MSTTKLYQTDMASKNSKSYQNLKTDAETDIQRLLESDPLIFEATVSITDITVSENSNRRKRSTENAVTEFIAVSSVQLTTIDNMEEIESSLSSSIQNADVNLYELIDEESLASFKLSFKIPTIINITLPSEEEIAELIGINLREVKNAYNCSENYGLFY